MSNDLSFGLEVDASGVRAVVWLTASGPGDQNVAVLAPMKFCENVTFHFVSEMSEQNSYFQKSFCCDEKILIKECYFFSIRGEIVLCHDHEHVLLALARLPAVEAIRKMLSERPSSPYDDALIEKKQSRESDCPAVEEPEKLF